MRYIALCLIVVVLTLHQAAADIDGLNIEELSWLAGEWIGEGREGDDGEIEGIARQYWSPPLEGSVSYFFTWHSQKTKHVHYAVNVFQQVDDRVVGKGVHYDRDFRNYEDNPWVLEATTIARDIVTFECVQYCRSESVSFRLLEDDTMEERWRLNPEEGKPDWIVRYRRVEN